MIAGLLRDDGVLEALQELRRVVAELVTEMRAQRQPDHRSEGGTVIVERLEVPLAADDMLRTLSDLTAAVGRRP